MSDTICKVDVAVIGLGLIGSAALRHLAGSGRSVVGVGPPEPADWSTHAGPFASHFDSGRITRRLDARFEWAELASRSIEQYAAVERATGIDFHRPVGFVFARDDDAGIANLRAVIERLGLPVTITTTDETDSGYTFPGGHTLLVEPAPAGHIDPRRMRAAQLAAATAAGAAVVPTWATSLDRIAGGFRVTARDGTVVEADRVLMATGPYLDDLVPFRLAARVVPEAVALGRVSVTDAEQLVGLPSMIYLPSDPDYEDVYVVPPVRYPDGHWYVKIGGSTVGVDPFETSEQKRRWMAGDGADQQLPRLRRMLEAVLPDVAFEGFGAKPCLITDTAHDLPYVDEVEDGLFVAVGGCGHAAKSSDAIGALAAGLVATGEWLDNVLDRSAFRVVLGVMRPPATSRHGS